MIILIDGYNMLHRARFGFAKGENNIVFNFFRMLKTITDCHEDIEKIFFVLEGHPEFRKILYPEYKANRIIDPNNVEKQNEMKDFRDQRDTILEILKKFPVDLVYHKDFECDDVIASLTESFYKKNKVLIVSTDTDFIQLLSYDEEWVSLWNPITKTFVKSTDYDYVSWKSLVGDSSDNIKGLDRVGDKTAKKILESDTLESFLDEKEDRRQIYERNYKLIKFAKPEPVNFVFISASSNFSEDEVKKAFTDLKFKSIISDKSWEKYWLPFKQLGLKNVEVNGANN